MKLIKTSFLSVFCIFTLIVTLTPSIAFCSLQDQINDLTAQIKQKEIERRSFTKNGKRQTGMNGRSYDSYTAQINTLKNSRARLLTKQKEEAAERPTVQDTRVGVRGNTGAGGVGSAAGR